MTVQITGAWNFPTRVITGPGRIAELPAACALLGIKRPLLVTDEGLRAAPMVQQALVLVPGTGLFADVRGNPVAANIEAGLAAYRARQWDDARDAFRAALAAVPNDEPSKIFIRRVDDFAANPPAGSWDGAWHFDHK